MRRRFAVRAAALATVGAVAYAGTNAWAGRTSPAELVVVQDVPVDVRAELDTTWKRFTDRFKFRRSCFTDVSVELVGRVEGGDARYVADDALIEIEIPTTPGRFRESFAHELAHHVERTCPEFATLRSRLHPMLGGSQRPWSGGELWQETPSELWAEAVVQVVNGERLLHDAEMPVDAAVIAQVEAWARGR